MIHAHKSLLSIRCSVLAIMFGSQFAEGQPGNLQVISIEGTSSEAFHSFVEFLYTDEVDFNNTDLAGLMVLADRYDVTRLQQLCEEKLAGYLWEALERICDQPGAVLDLENEMDFTLAELIGFAKEHNAKQLEAYCNHLWSFYPQHFQWPQDGDDPSSSVGGAKSKRKGKEREKSGTWRGLRTTGDNGEVTHPSCSIM